MERLVETVFLAVLESAAAAGDEIAAYAVVVDSGLMSAMGASMATSFARDPANRRVLFSPVNWPIEHLTDLYDQVGEVLSHVPDGAYEERARRVADALIEALASARSALPLLRDATLLVECADGGGVWSEIERDAAQRLNPPSVYRGYELWRAEARHDT